MKVGLACFLVVIFLAQNAQTGFFEAQNFAYKKLNTNEAEYFLNSLNTLPEAGTINEGALSSNIQGINIETLSAQIAEKIKTAVEPLLLKEADEIQLSTPLFAAHQSKINILLYSFMLGIVALIFIQKQKLIFKLNQSFRLKQILNRISPRSPNFN